VFLGEFVAHFKFTVLLMPNGPHRITGLPFEPELYQSDYAISDPELKVCNLLWYAVHACWSKFLQALKCEDVSDFVFIFPLS